MKGWISVSLTDRYVTHQISLGDFVSSGGEIAAMALLDAVVSAPARCVE
jgi:tRNA (guanine37-N1)-methyltransferase